MNIPKAIEILETEERTAAHQTEPDFYDALHLGIEALKRLQHYRLEYFSLEDHLLPGETKD